MTDATRREAHPAADRTGVWFVGARGSVATTAMVGALAVRSGLADLTGLVSELPEVAAAGLPALSGLVFGGHDIATISLPKRVEALAAAGVIPHHLPLALAGELAAIDKWIRPGLRGRDKPQRAAAESLEADLLAFGQAHGLSRIVVVDVSSTEPPAPEDPALTREAGSSGRWTQMPRHCRPARCTRMRRSGLAARWWRSRRARVRGYQRCRNWPGSARCPGRARTERPARRW